MPRFDGNSDPNLIKGSSFDDLLLGRGGDDTLIGYAGDDVLNGGTGVDDMAGNAGNDVYIVDDANDVVRELISQGVDTVRASVSYTLAAGSYVERLITNDDDGTAEIDLTGNGLSNYLRGNAGSNYLSGGDGNDVLVGLDGSDTLWGGDGRDRMVGGSGDDIFVFTGTSRDRIDDFESGHDVIDLGLILGFQQFTFIGDAAFSGASGQGRFNGSQFQLDLNGDQIADLVIDINAPLAGSDIVFFGG